MYNVAFIKSGIVYIRDLWNFEHKRWYTNAELSVEYALETPWFDYIQILSAIPAHWSSLLKNVF